MIRVEPLYKRRRQSDRRRPKASSLFGRQYSAFSRGTGFFHKREGNTENNFIVTAAHIFHKPGNIPPKYLPATDFFFIQFFDRNSPAVTIKNYQSNQTETWMLIPKTSLFKAQKPEILFRGFNTDNIDWAYIEIQKNEVSKEYPEDYTTPYTGKYNLEQSVYGIGHGLGLPKKMHLDAKITLVDKDDIRFKACLDFFSGNSGSPIFDSLTHKVMGILFKGKTDFVEDGFEIAISRNRCIKGGGESCQMITVIPESKKLQKSLAPERINNPIRIGAPYLYLVKDKDQPIQTERKFLLFILIPLKAGFVADPYCLTTVDDTDYIKIKLKAKTGSTKPYDTQKVPLTFDENTFTQRIVNVYVEQEDGTEFIGKLRYKDTEDNTDSDDYSNTNQALNAPYIYLTNPTGQNIYYPRLLMLAKNASIANDNRDSNGEDKYVETKIILKQESTSNIKLISDFNVNKNDFTYSDVTDEGHFDTEISFPLPNPLDNDKTKKERIRNSNADIKPLGFEL